VFNKGNAVLTTTITISIGFEGSQALAGKMTVGLSWNLVRSRLAKMVPE